MSKLEELQKELRQLVDEHNLCFKFRPLDAGIKLEKLISKAFIAGCRQTRLELRGEAECSTTMPK